LDVTVAVEGQVALLVISQVTVCPLVSVVVVNVVPPDPAFTPFTFHWYVGEVPPLVGVAVNVTLVPAHIVVMPETAAGVDTIDTEGVTVVLMVKFVPLSVPVTAGELLVTRIL
jgi:hypothetical protein